MLMEVVHVLGVLMAVITTATALAHLLELPGKKRLSREEYLVVQKIYYPGFTIAGTLEVPTILLLSASTILTGFGQADFWLRASASVAFAAVHITYWLRVHPLNTVWLDDTALTTAATGFFATGPVGPARDETWTRLRDRWENGHALRAVLAAVGLIAAITALA